MASPRLPKDDPGQPSSIQVGGGSAASGDRLLDISQKLGGIERSVTYLEARSTESDKKIDGLSHNVTALAKEMAEAKAMLTALQPIISSVGKALWAIVAGVTLFILGIASMWIKHHFGW